MSRETADGGATADAGTRADSESWSGPADGGSGSDGDPATEGYRFRRYRPDDVEGVLAVDRAVWDRDRDPEWFRWKYERNPFVDDAPVYVAERDGTIVGARPFMALRLRAGDDVRLAFQPADTMVHPAHRRRGLFTRMNETAIAEHERRPTGLYFNFPNSQSRPGYEQLGWRPVRPQVTYHRIERPAALLGDATRRRVLGRVAGVPVRGYSRARRAMSGAGTDGRFEVDRTDGVDVERLVALYGRRVPRQIHALRDGTFLEWRFGSPAWSRRTYVASEGGLDVAGVVSRTRRLDDGTVLTQVADVLPLVGGTRWRAALEELLVAVLEDHDRTDLFSVARGPIPDDLLGSLGFLPDDRLPLSRLSSYEKTLLTRPFDLDSPGAWTWNGRRLDRPDNWLFTYAEWDTA